MGLGPFSPCGYPRPHQCAKFQTFALRGWGRRIFWKFSNLQTWVRGPNRGCISWKTPHWYRSGSCAILSPIDTKVQCGVIFLIFAPNSQGAPPNFTQVYFLFRPILRACVQPRSDCHCSDCPRPTPTMQSVLVDNNNRTCRVPCSPKMQKMHWMLWHECQGDSSSSIKIHK